MHALPLGDRVECRAADAVVGRPEETEHFPRERGAASSQTRRDPDAHRVRGFGAVHRCQPVDRQPEVTQCPSSSASEQLVLRTKQPPNGRSQLTQAAGLHHPDRGDGDERLAISQGLPERPNDLRARLMRKRFHRPRPSVPRTTVEVSDSAVYAVHQRASRASSPSPRCRSRRGASSPYHRLCSTGRSTALRQASSELR